MQGVHTYESPDLDAGAPMWRIARAVGLDENSPYKYLLFCRDFAETSVVARIGDEHVGFVTGYRRPAAPDTLFVWQIGVLESAQGRGIAGGMLGFVMDRLADQGVRYLEATVEPDNEPSNRLFSGFADRRNAPWERSPLFPGSMFPTQHDDEVLIRIGPVPVRSADGAADMPRRRGN